MGLALAVGIFAELDDEEDVAHYRDCFQSLSRDLVANGLAPHAEPENCDAWDGEMIGYSGLHDLRRIAAYLDSDGTLPEPATTGQSSHEDERLQAYMADADGKATGWFGKLVGRPKFARRFDHLILHSDAEGYYLPQDFEDVLLASEEVGGMLGSAPRLLAELEVIANALEIPQHLNAASEELWDASDGTTSAEPEMWERYGRESYSCVVLREGCRRCIESGAALVFT